MYETGDSLSLFFFMLVDVVLSRKLTKWHKRDVLKICARGGEV